jgi:hypothetical protein
MAAAGRRGRDAQIIVTRGTKAGIRPASTAYLTHLLDGCGCAPA